MTRKIFIQPITHIQSNINIKLTNLIYFLFYDSLLKDSAPVQKIRFPAMDAMDYIKP
jgi:hypothetical protein